MGVLFTNRAYIDTNSIYKIMVGMQVFTGNQVFTGTDNASGERDNHRLKRCELSQTRTVSLSLRLHGLDDGIAATVSVFNADNC